MCGIAGFVGPGYADAIGRMVEVQAHRGPDDAGVHCVPSDRVALGHRRLSIIDLSPAGHQPMSNEDGTVWISFAGEMYNFRELRPGLEARGHRFRSTSDTEVIVHQYEEDGPRCLERLEGMFALTILDIPRRRLLLARDRYGVKPLYYLHEGGRLVFATEIKAILASGAYRTDVNWQAVWDYFTYLYVPCPDTMFRGIRQVPPAHLLELDLATGQARLDPYWRVASPVRSNGRVDLPEMRAELRRRLAASVRAQQVSDVPLGVFLSGGIDSPVLTGLMAESAARVRTFTVVFRGREFAFYDERDRARAVAQRFATDHRELEVEVDDPAAMLDLVRYFDQPFGNPTFYLMYLIARATRQEATVALCGAGGDELFAGYPRYRAMQLARWLRRVPPLVRDGLRRAVALIGEGHRTMTLRRARQFLEGLDPDPVREFVQWTYYLDEPAKIRLLDQHGPLSVESASLASSDRVLRRLWAASPFADAGTRALHVDTQSFLPDNLLEYTDKMSMAVSLEVRVPYLDRAVVEHAFTIPFDAKLRRADGKAVLKETFADLLPDEVRTAPKRGFNAPLARWMLDRLDAYFDRHLDRVTVARAGIFVWDELLRLRSELRAGRRDTSHELFAVIMFDVWFRRYITGQPEDDGLAGSRVAKIAHA